MQRTKYIRPFRELGIGDVDVVGGKNASLGEMLRELSSQGVKVGASHVQACRDALPHPSLAQVPDGFATTAEAFRAFLSETKLPERIDAILSTLDLRDTQALHLAGERIRGWILDATLPADLQQEILDAYRAMSAADAKEAHAAGNLDAEGMSSHAVTVAVRSSATAEDLPDASFAGQQETYLGVHGEEALLRTVRRVMASLYTDRAIVYRATHGFSHDAVALSVGIQKMVRSDLGCSGVMFTLDTESGFRDVCLITGAYGLGETVVQGSVTPDEWLVFKPLLVSQPQCVPIVRSTLGSKAIKMVYSQDRVTADATTTVTVAPADQKRFCLSDEEVLTLTRYGIAIEAHYSAKAGMWRPMDIEWAKDGLTGQLFVVQARPETVHSARAAKDGTTTSVFRLDPAAAKTAHILAQGRAVGNKIGAGAVRIILDPSGMHRLRQGEVLVTDMTTPDWVPAMQRASAIVTQRGGRVCHAAIVARELGLPCVVGAPEALHTLSDGEAVTVVCSEGDTGCVYGGTLPFTETEVDTQKLEQPQRLHVSLILGNPSEAFSLARLPVRGVGLVRLEFVINSVGLHPMACLEVDALPAELQSRIRAACVGSPTPAEHYIRSIAEGVASICAAFYPEQCIVRLSDFKTNEYAALLGGERYEPKEANPMLGFRGASRYYDPRFKAAFALECEAMRRVREVMVRCCPRPPRITPPPTTDLVTARAFSPVGPHQLPRHGSLCAVHRGVGARAGLHGPQRPAARRWRPAHLRHVRDPHQCPPGGCLPRPLRRLLHREQRPHAADPGRGPRLRCPGRAGRERRVCEAADRHGHRRRQACGQVHRHLWPGAERQPSLRPLAGAPRHRGTEPQRGRHHHHPADHRGRGEGGGGAPGLRIKRARSGSVT
jgi:pyruvate,water dikinase